MVSTVQSVINFDTFMIHVCAYPYGELLRDFHNLLQKLICPFLKICCRFSNATEDLITTVRQRVERIPPLSSFRGRQRSHAVVKHPAHSDLQEMYQVRT